MNKIYRVYICKSNHCYSRVLYVPYVFVRILAAATINFGLQLLECSYYIINGSFYYFGAIPVGDIDTMESFFKNALISSSEI